MVIKLKSIFGGFLRSLHMFWLEIVGSLFLAIAVMFGSYAAQEYRRYLNGRQSGPWMLLCAAGLSLLTLLFGVRSFWRARKLR